MRLRQQLRKLLAERMRTLLNGLPRCAISHHGVVRNHQDFVTRQSRRQIVRDQQTTDVALLNTTAKQLKDLRFGDWIERTGGSSAMIKLALPSNAIAIQIRWR